MFGKIMDIVAAFRAGEWRLCVKLIAALIADNIDSLPGDVPSEAQSFVECSPTWLVAELETRASQSTATAFDFGVFLPILLELFDRLLKRRKA